MIPYLAIIKDSFRAALRSLMLRTLFAVVTMLLVLLLPFGYTEMLTGRLGWREVRNWPAVLDVIYVSQQSTQPSPGRHIWSLLSPPLQSETERFYEQLEEEARIREEGDPLDEAEARFAVAKINSLAQMLHAELDENLLADEAFYDERSWANVQMSDEAKELLALKPEEMAERQVRRRNRLLLEAAFPLLVPRSPPLSVRPTYLGRPIDILGRAEGNTKDAVIKWYRGYIGWMMDWQVSMTLVLVAIIATAGIMPRMFEPGSISLLLSKPITRTRLFLAQFAGGCAFMLLASVYFVVGVWLIAGLRLGIWNPSVFWCIPLFTFIFMVYYAVSAYVGLVYRSPVVSVLAAVMLFYLCFGLGLAKISFDDTFVDAARLVHVVDTGETLVAANQPLLEPINHYTYDETHREWKEIFIPEGFSPFGPPERAIYDPRGDQLLAAGFQSLIVGRARDAWVRKQGAPAPPGIVSMLVEPEGSVLAVSRYGFYRLTGEALSESPDAEASAGAFGDAGPPGDDLTGAAEEDQAEQADTAEELGAPESVAPTDEAIVAPPEPGIEETPDAEIQPQPGFAPEPPETPQLDAFTFVGPDKLPPLEPPMTVAMDPSSGRIVVYANGELAVYARNEKGEYAETARKELPESQEKSAAVAAAGSVVIVARDDGKLLILDAKTLDLQQQLSPEREVAARFAVASDDGQWAAILFHNRKLWLYDVRERHARRAMLWTQGDISAVAFSGNRLLVVDRVARAREFELPSMRQTRAWKPRKLPYLSETTEVFPGVHLSYYGFHRWVVTPLYTILPKPGELGWAVSYLVTGKQTQMGFWSRLFQRGESTSDERHQVRNPWRGVWSCAIFVAFMLALSCWHIHRTEF